MLDSSPAALPPARRPLKRSASTASLASLPTPPRTHRRHARGRSRGSCDSDSDDHAILSTDDEAPDARKNKKRRTTQVPNDEEAFWLGGSSAATTEASTAGSSKATNGPAAATSTSKSHTAPLIYRRMIVQQQQQVQVEVAPVSPPPSHRKAAVVAPLKPQSVSDTASSPPTTPRTRSATKRASLLLQDSPDNPFLSTPQKATVEDSASPSPSVSSANPSPHTPNHHEKPTLTYVFRGVRRTYQNPLYNHAEDRPYSPSPASLLPIDHPEYSPPIHCTPKLLFPAARRNLRGKKQKAAASRARSPSMSGDERDGADIRPQKLDFGKAENKDNEKKNKNKSGKTAKKEVQERKIADEEVFL